MTTARAAVAGMLAAVLVFWAARGIGREFTQPELTALLVLLAVISLLIVPDAVSQYRRLRGRERSSDDDDPSSGGNP